MKVVLLGGTKGIGRALGRLLVERGARLCLLGRDLEDLPTSAKDLEVRSQTRQEVFIAECDLATPSMFKPALEAAESKLGGLDTVIVTAGLFATQETLEEDPRRALELLTVNFAHTVAFCEEARKRLIANGGGALCVFSSVAGDRGRKPVILYGASKAGLSAYLEGLDHKFRSKGLRTICVKPGFVKTGMTANLEPPLFAAESCDVARDVLKAIDRGSPLIYTPPAWRYIMMVIRNLPRSVMRRVSF